jgi:hypothetical protein
MTETPS